MFEECNQYNILVCYMLEIPHKIRISNYLVGAEHYLGVMELVQSEMVRILSIARIRLIYKTLQI